MKVEILSQHMSQLASNRKVLPCIYLQSCACDVVEKLAAMNEASKDDDDIVNGSHDDDDAGADDSDFDIDTSTSSHVKEKVAA